MSYYFALLKHYLVATRIDVLHSPFVFKLYNACIKSNKNIASLTGALASYLNFESKFRITEQKDVVLLQENQLYDFLIIDTNTTLPDDAIEQILNTLSSTCCILMEKPYTNKYRINLLKTLSAHPQIHVTVDLFHCALLFKRQEQAREYFRLRWY